MLSQIAKLYCVTIDDLFKKTSVVYENYAQRSAAVYESTRRPEDFISADFEFKKMMKNGICSTEDLRYYGILHHYMMRYCIDKSVDLFDKVIEQGKDVDKDVFWRTKHKKMLLYSQIGKGQESIDAAQKIINEGSEDWICLIAAYRYRRKALELDDEMYDAGYSMGFCYEELGEYGKAYDTWLAIARNLEKDGYEVEKNYPLESAEKCQEILKKGPRLLPENATGSQYDIVL